MKPFRVALPNVGSLCGQVQEKDAKRDKVRAQVTSIFETGGSNGGTRKTKTTGGANRE